MYFLVLIVIALIMAGILQGIFNKKVPGGYWNRLVGAFIGGWVGDLILGDWGWMLADYNVIAGIIGSFIIGWLYILLVAKKN